MLRCCVAFPCFCPSGVLAYTHYGGKRLVKAAAWAAAAVLAMLIIAARKHYTVDVVIAWYTVPMVYTLLHVFWRQRCNPSSYTSLPTTADEYDKIAVPAGKAATSCYVTVAAGPASSKQQIDLPNIMAFASSSCSSCTSSGRCSTDGCAEDADSSSSYCSSYNRSPRSDVKPVAAADSNESPGTGRNVSPRRMRNVWLFGRNAPWRQQQQQFVPDALGASSDVEAGRF
jgi:hypothetical protein